ncbi:MAG TPA: aminoglycoside phosphotransferase [Pseudonocardiaceae bacterium]|nr:aminoglycoside phosphotransferase [Pseudonocardiaceae bacterium]
MTLAASALVLEAVTDSLADWLPTQRWFAGKGRAVQGARPVHAVTLINGDPGLVHAVVAVEQDGAEHLYQLLLGLRREPPEYLRSAVLGKADDQICYEATGDPELASRLLDEFGRLPHGSPAELRFELEPGVALEHGSRARLAGVEQSNSSLIFGQEYVLKLFRRLIPGPSRDLEITRGLYRVGCRQVARPLGSVHGEIAGAPVVFGLLQRFLPDAVEGWAMATASVRDLMAEGDLHAGEVGGDFAGEAQRLGSAVATVHSHLRIAFGARMAEADEIAETVRGMHDRLDGTVAAVPALAPQVPALRDAYDEVLRGTSRTPVQNVHGDLHLGQALRTTANWVLIDFEGEPAALPAERTAFASPLRDVAGMLRSFDYAAHALALAQSEDHQTAVRAREWADRNRTAFCAGYAETGADPDDQAPLLRALELDKAVYEVRYEHDNRPDWLPIPLAAIARITAADA